MIVLFIFLVLLFSFIFLKIKCPKCGGRMDDVGLCDGHTVYRCRKCGEEYI